MNSEQQHLTKLLAPLIIFIVLVIILTLVFHGRSLEQKTAQQDLLPVLEMRLDRHTVDEISFSRKTETKEGFKFPSVEEVLSSARYEYNADLLPEAEERLRTALVFYPDHKGLYHLLGSLLYKKKEFPGAEKIFRHLVRLDRTDSLAYNNLASVLASMDRYPEALDTVRQAYELNEYSPLIILNLAGICARNGRKQESLQYFRDAYRVLGHRILHFIINRNFDPIREEKIFRDIVKDAREKQGKIR